MIRDEIIEKAEEAGICLQDMRYHYDKLDDNFIDKLNVFAELVSMKVYLEGVEAGRSSKVTSCFYVKKGII